MAAQDEQAATNDESAFSAPAADSFAGTQDPMSAPDERVADAGVGSGQLDTHGDALAIAAAQGRQDQEAAESAMDVDRPNDPVQPSDAGDSGDLPLRQLALIDAGPELAISNSAGEVADDLLGADSLPRDEGADTDVTIARDGPVAAEDAEATWLGCVRRTADAAALLSENLRLILEPTAMTRLQGDFKTGKRLSMRRVIQYIASDYTKDKIWLRRTRPSGREYQVIIALDDSQSMAASQSDLLALDALALVTGALQRLEVGDVAVARFGAEADFVREFDSGPLSIATGASMVSAFHFNQRTTDLPRLLRATTERFDVKRATGSSHTAGDLWQLAIIISDGLCQDIEETRRLLRQAAEGHILVVFIVIDALRQHVGAQPAATSIFDLKSASYQRTANGQLELQLTRYMDSFPFDSYVVIRSADALPDALSTTLRQFFERAC